MRVLLVACVLVSTAAPAQAAGIGLTRDVPRQVTRVCESARAASPIPLVCPPLVPVTRYATAPGLSGALLGNTNLPPLGPPRDRIYLLGFNAGFDEPGLVHWIAGMGSPEAVRHWVLSDALNEVKGKPRRLRALWLGNRRVELWRFPDHPAGGAFGGHVAAIVRSGPYLALASIHGDDTAGPSARMAVALARRADAERRSRTAGTAGRGGAS